MSILIKTPILPESISEAKIIAWYQKVGDMIPADAHLLDVETDKIVLEVSAPTEGTLLQILKQPGDLVHSEEVLGLFEPKTAQLSQLPMPVSETGSENLVSKGGVITSEPHRTTRSVSLASPALRRFAAEASIDLTSIEGTGKHGLLTKTDLMKAAALDAQGSAPNTKPAEQSVSLGMQQCVGQSATAPALSQARTDRAVPMSRLRARIAARLSEAQRDAVILTTFNEINMQPVMDLRKKYNEAFEKDYGVRLGFATFFVFAVVEALKKFPIINASVRGEEIVYHDYYDISVAVSSERGLVVPVIRDANTLHMAEIQRKISEFSEKANKNQLSLEEMKGGTFTISNGGLFGSLMSTPILNPPQSAILGMHKIMPRPMVLENEIHIKPMMYVALSYDHRIIDGSESVRFLVMIKDLLEDPARLLLEI